MTKFTKVALTNSPIKYVSFKNSKVGDLLVIGTLSKIEIVPGFEGRGTVPKYTFETDEGVTVLNSAGQLNYFLNREENVGEAFEITYLGEDFYFDKKTKKQSTRKAHNFEVVKLVQDEATSAS